MGSAALSYTVLLLHALDKKEMAREMLAVLKRHKRSWSGHKPMWSTKGNSSWTVNRVESAAIQPC